MGPVHVQMYSRVELLVHGQRCLIPAGRSLELLVLLSAFPGTIVVEGALYDRLGATPSAAVDNELHRHVSALRRAVHAIDPAISDDWIHQVEGGYATDPQLVSSDITAVEELPDDDVLHTSLLWWTEPLPGLPLDPFLHVHARLDTAAMRLAGVAMDHASSLDGADIDRLIELLARHPDQEDLWARLVEVAIQSDEPYALSNVKMELMVMQRDGLAPFADGLLARIGEAAES